MQVPLEVIILREDKLRVGDGRECGHRHTAHWCLLLTVAATLCHSRLFTLKAPLAPLGITLLAPRLLGGVSSLSLFVLLLLLPLPTFRSLPLEITISCCGSRLSGLGIALVSRFREDKK